MRKALIIGLGGSGFDICESLAQRLRWEMGDLDRCKFLDFYCIDSAKDRLTGASLLSRDKHFYHMQISPDTFAAMRLRPKDFDSQNGFSRWYNPEIMDLKAAVTDGTGALRMLGRMALMLPQNWSHIYDEISRKINDLVNLTEDQARSAYGRRFDGTTPNISFPDRVSVYVVTTACGGTGSGTFVDFGFMLRKLCDERFRGRVNTIGILTLPASAEKDHQRKANAYATLIELNHYSTDYTEYRDKYPNSPTEVSVYNYPYDFPYLVTCENSNGQGGLKDHKALNYTVAQYIYSDVMYDVTSVRDGRRDDVARRFISSDRKGLSQRFMTFGVSFIDYPVERIMRGCTYKLLTRTFEFWMGDHRAAVPDPVGKFELSPQLLQEELLTSPQGSLSVRFRQNIRNLVESYTGPDDITDFQRRLAAALTPVPNRTFGQVPATDLPAGYVPYIAQMGLQTVPAKYIRNIRSHLEAALFDIDLGPSYCRELLAQLSAYLGQPRTFIAGSKHEEMDELIEILKVANRDVLLRFPLPFIGRVEINYLEKWVKVATAYYTDKLHEACLPFVSSVYEQLKIEVDFLSARMENVETYLMTGQKAFERLLREEDQSINVNGELLFRAGATDKDEEVSKLATISQEYESTFKTSKRFPGKSAESIERLVAAETVAKLKPIAIMDDADTRSLFAPPGKSFFDAGESGKFANLRKIHQELGMDNAKPQFLDLQNTNVITAFSSRFSDERQPQKLQEINLLSNWFLPLNLNAAEYDNHPAKEHHWIFYRGATDEEPTHTLERFQNNIHNVAGNAEICEMPNPHNAIFLSEYGAFPLRIITSVSDWRQYYLAAMGLREDSTGMARSEDDTVKEVPTLFTREDVAWVTFEETDRDKLLEAEELFLIGLALEVIQPLQGGIGFVLHAANHDNTRPIQFDTHLRRNAWRLYKRPELRAQLKNTLFRNRRAGQQNSVMIKTLYENFLNQRFAVINIEGIPGKDLDERRDYVTSVFNRYIKRDIDLMHVYQEVYPKNTNLSYLFRQKDTKIFLNDINSPTYPENGYYCENTACNQFFGPNESDIPPVCPKPTCSSFYYHSVGTHVTSG